MSKETLDEWWTMFTDDPCDDICKDIHEWITRLVKEEKDGTEIIYHNA